MEGKSESVSEGLLVEKKTKTKTSRNMSVIHLKSINPSPDNHTNTSLLYLLASLCGRKEEDGRKMERKSEEEEAQYCLDQTAPSVINSCD